MGSDPPDGRFEPIAMNGRVPPSADRRRRDLLGGDNVRHRDALDTSLAIDDDRGRVRAQQLTKRVGRLPRRQEVPDDDASPDRWQVDHPQNRSRGRPRPWWRCADACNGMLAGTEGDDDARPTRMLGASARIPAEPADESA